MATTTNEVRLYETGGGLLLLWSVERQRGYDVTGVGGSFAEDASALAAGVDGDWTVPALDKEPEETHGTDGCRLIARWRDGEVEVFAVVAVAGREYLNPAVTVHMLPSSARCLRYTGGCETEAERYAVSRGLSVDWSSQVETALVDPDRGYAPIYSAPIVDDED